MAHESIHKEFLLAFIRKCTSPYHTVKSSEDYLRDYEFQSLSLDEKWHLKEGANFMVNIFGTTLIAFKIGHNFRKKLRITAAHSDFPNLRLKSSCDVKQEGYHSLNVEVYGGPILNTWLDRPLSIAGKVTIARDGATEGLYFDYREPFAVIPNVAIHLNKKVNDGVSLNKQLHLMPLVGNDEGEDFLDFLSRELEVPKEDILFYDLGLYPFEPGCAFGIHEEFISCGRLDNCTSVKGALDGLTEASGEGLQIAAIFDNEEVGSRTKQGAASTMLQQVLERIYYAFDYSREELSEDMGKALMLSLDVAHGYHPNYGDRYDTTNKVILNNGVAIKYAANQTYAGDVEGTGRLIHLCKQHDISYQLFYNRSDQVGGSTLGSIGSAMVPVRTIDVGVPLLGMHSAREAMGTKDQHSLEALITHFYTDDF